MIPAKKVVRKAVRLAIGDYNMWPSEGDAPLVISSRNGAIPDDEGFLRLDASLRRRYAADNATEGYTVPTDRTVSRFTLDDKVWPLVMSQLESVSNLMGSTPTPADIEREAEILEYYIQLYNQFKLCGNPVVVEVRSVAEAALVGFFIAGEVTDDKVPTEVDTLYARTLLVQT